MDNLEEEYTRIVNSFFFKLPTLIDFSKEFPTFRKS